MPTFNFPKNEEDVLHFWQENKIFEKSLEKKSPKGDFIFYDGPPFATGLPHYGHIVASVMKDVVPRYKTMRGYRVPRRWGWDCHGLPIENLVEKELRLKGKEDILKIGIDKFNNACHSKVLMYANEWKKFIPRIGRWVNMEDDYRTMNPEFMESVWWVFKTLYDKGLIYEGYKSMHLCPRCETTLSNFEVSQNYKDIKDLSVTAKFKLKNPEKLGLDKDTYILSWTTTPWTLPGNVALAVGENIKYTILHNNSSVDRGIKDGEMHLTPGYYIIATDRIPEITREGNYFTETKKEITGADLVGLEYEPLFDDFLKKSPPNRENLYKVVSANFVTTADGTGVVHIAPAFGEEDLQLGIEKKLSFIQHVDESGKITVEMGERFTGLEVKPRGDAQATDKKIVEYLRSKELVFSSEEYLHSYPHCWRCETPLINYAASSWFVRVTKIKEKMLARNREINWMPKNIRDGRFGKWLEGAKDWAISRNRYWGTPLPVWRCAGNWKGEPPNARPAKIPWNCGDTKIIGSIKELEKLSGQKVDDLHSQFVNEIEIPCKCGGRMKRIPEVLDCWFESGSMPYAQFATKEKTKLPADFIAEGVDQTRGWFYTLLVLATGLFNKPPFQNVIVNGIVLAEDGQKMSKSKKNYPDPNDVIAKYGADALRFYLLASPVMRADDLRFSERELKETFQKVLMILMNIMSFYEMYAGALPPPSEGDPPAGGGRGKNILDRWIISKLNKLISDTTDAMEKYDLNEAVRPLGEFINDLSTWYLRRSRDRFKSDDEKDKAAALKTLGFTLWTLAKILAPFTPFIAETLYKKTCGNLLSVHLEDWPENEKISGDLLREMDLARKIASLGLEARAKAGIAVRQPLGALTVIGGKLSDELREILKDELNIKEISFAKGEMLSVELSTEITPELRLEGLKRELVRNINALRKEAGLTIADRIVLHYETDDEEIKKVFAQFGTDLLKDTLSKKIVPGRHIERGSGDAKRSRAAVSAERELQIGDAKVWIGF